MEKAETMNQTSIFELVLTGFGNDSDLRPLLFLVFLVIYLVAVSGNLLILVLVVADRHLHTPMYYFVANLSSVEICYVSTTLPRLMDSLATGDRTISLHNCYVQFYFYIILSNAECLLLTAMCIDRYLAICHPLRYAALMTGRVCCHMVAWAWIFGISYCVMMHVFILQSRYCGPKEIPHFFCDFAVVANAFCGTNTRILQMLTFVLSVILTVGLFLLTLTSYICIIASILQIPSGVGRQKAFSTCSSHLIVVTLYYLSVMTVYLVTLFNSPPIVHKLTSVWFTILIPLLNPVLYFLRNKEVHEALQKTPLKLSAFRHKPGV